MFKTKKSRIVVSIIFAATVFTGLAFTSGLFFGFEEIEPGLLGAIASLSAVLAAFIFATIIIVCVFGIMNWIEKGVNKPNKISEIDAESLDKLRDIWFVEGPNPDYHNYMKMVLKKDWRSLYDEITRLIK